MTEAVRINEESVASTDPVTIELIRHALQSITDELELDISRTAFSPILYEYKDYAMGLIDASGALIAQCRGGIPIFLANVLGQIVRDGIDIYGLDGIHPGDVLLSNYTGTTGQHSNHFVAYTPVFGSAGTILCFSVVLIHCVDVGGRYVGSVGSDTTDIFQEGVQIRSVKIEANYQPVREIYRIIEHNTRFPDMMMGDIASQIAACKKGAALFSALVRKYSERALMDAIHVIWDQTEASVRKSVRKIPNGSYRATSFLDNDGVQLDRKIAIDISVIVEDESVTIDLSNVEDQVQGPFNSGRNGGGITAARVAFRYLTSAGSDMTNEGSFRPLKVVLPPGKFLSAGATAPMGAYSLPLATVIDTIIHAFADVVPQKVSAGHHANFGVHKFQGHHPATGKLYNHHDTVLGGWGASMSSDGTGPFKTQAHADTRDIPVEVVEALYPLRVEYLRLRTDSAGAGRHRGGLGMDKCYTALAPCKGMVIIERHGCPPWGVAGGCDAKPASAEIVDRVTRAERSVLKVSGLPMAAGDQLVIHSGGGGGWGPPTERAPERVLEDVRQGYVSTEAAERDYGVRILADKIDEAATQRLRDR